MSSILFKYTKYYILFCPVFYSNKCTKYLIPFMGHSILIQRALYSKMLGILFQSTKYSDPMYQEIYSIMSSILFYYGKYPLQIYRVFYSILLNITFYYCIILDLLSPFIWQIIVWRIFSLREVILKKKQFKFHQCL